jgi:hypothetical protein
MGFWLSLGWVVSKRVLLGCGSVTVISKRCAKLDAIYDCIRDSEFSMIGRLRRYLRKTRLLNGQQNAKLVLKS